MNKKKQLIKCTLSVKFNETCIKQSLLPKYTIFLQILDLQKAEYVENRGKTKRTRSSIV